MLDYKSDKKLWNFDFGTVACAWHRQVAAAAPRPDKHTPLQNNKAKRSRPLNRLGELPLLRSLVFFRVY